MWLWAILHPGEKDYNCWWWVNYFDFSPGWEVSKVKSILIDLSYNGTVNSIQNQPWVRHRSISVLLRKGSSSTSCGRTKSLLKSMTLALSQFSMKISTWQWITSGKVSSRTYLINFFSFNSVISLCVSSISSQEKIILSEIFDDSWSKTALRCMRWDIDKE